ncbi:MAG: serine/threonine-protein kinase [Acidobacteria bacterium]|nr:serine/threonine-protein kinase [Acidobacteriota bacterium]
MTLQHGSSLGPYEILAPLGAGGMGEVYRARDTRLGREVALKVLPPAFAEDPNRLARFQREANLLASLSHPRIGQIYGLEESGAQLTLVMELVEGEDLSARLKRGPLPVAEVLDLAKQLAEGLAAAHEKGIVHRDLKPANLRITPEGALKILDFGLAKAVNPAAASNPDLSHSPTMAMTGTEVGVILGTAPYMSPEQAKGKAVDTHTDIWAFGVVVHELLTGRPLFTGETVSDILAAVLRQEVTETELPADTPASLRRLLHHCLQRDPHQRLRDIGDVGLLLAEPMASGPHLAPSSGAPPASRLRAWALPALAGGALLLPLGFWAGSARKVSPPPIRFEVNLPGKATLTLDTMPALALSRDGRALAFVANEGGLDRLFLRRLESLEAKPLPGTEGARGPAFSPDGRWIAFFGNGKLRKVSVEGIAMALADVADGRGVDWLDAENLVYSPGATHPLFRVSANGGPAEPLTQLRPERQERTHRFPHVLPGGKAVLFTVGVFSSPDAYDDATLDVLEVATGRRETLHKGARMTVYSPSGHLLLVRGIDLFALPFDPGALKVLGLPAAAFQGLAGDSSTGASHLALSGTGSLAFIPGRGDENARRLYLCDRKGALQAIDLPGGVLLDPALSPDGRRLALVLDSLQGNSDIWVYDLERGTFSRISFKGLCFSPVWSRDGKSITYSDGNPRENKTTIYRRTSDGSREAEAVATFQGRISLAASLPGDQEWVATRFDPKTNPVTEVVRLSQQAGRAPEPLIATTQDAFAPALSPDGKWLAYAGTEGGVTSVYVKPYGTTNARWLVSTGPGQEPKWSRDGKELHYRSNRGLWAVPVESTPTFRAGTPRLLFEAALDYRTDSDLSFDVQAKGGGFLMLRPYVERAPKALQVIQHWTEALKPGNR